MQQEGLLEH